MSADVVAALEAAGTFDAGRLIRNLEAQLAGYGRLVALAERQHAGLVGGRSDDVSEVLAEQQATLIVLQTLEQERPALVTPLAASLTLREVAERTPAPARARLETLGADLLATAETLRGLNRQNGRLLARSVRTLQRWQRHMLRSFLPRQTYAADGAMTRGDRPWALDEVA